MGRWFRIPGLVDLIRGDAAPDIRILAGDSRLDRRFEVSGPLINRLLAGRVRRVLQVDGAPLPSVAPRHDTQRAQSQEALRLRLDPPRRRPLWGGETIIGPVRALRRPPRAPPPRPAAPPPA